MDPFDEFRHVERYEDLDGKFWLRDVRECKDGKGAVDSMQIRQMQ